MSVATSTICPSCGREDERMLRVRTSVDGMSPCREPSRRMCLSCVLGWPNTIEDWWAEPNGMIHIRHRAVIGEAGKP